MMRGQPTGQWVSLAQKQPPPVGRYRWVYLWQWPIRAMHWTAAICLVTLAVTGLYIGKPYFMTGGEASSHFLMGWVRFIHFAAAALLVMTAIVRMYWLFRGNRYERLPALFPVRRRDWGNLVRMVRYYLMLEPEQVARYLGHNPLQQFSYTAIYGLGAIMVVTGFAMYGQSNPSGFIYGATNWIGALMGGMPVVRFVHHVGTWGFLIFIPIHVYLSIRADLLERTGVMSSIVSGGRFVPTDQHFVDE
jgi:Ni/Fe-hydrogenase b-type cytochrome subunit